MSTAEITAKHTFLTDPPLAMGQTFEGECDLRINEVATRGSSGPYWLFRISSAFAWAWLAPAQSPIWM